MAEKAWQTGVLRREDRLKAALKANMAKRKSQARARAEKAADTKADEQDQKDRDNG